MKLVIIETCVGKGGRILERGQIHSTGDVEAKDDAEAYQLIASGRAIKADTAEGQQALTRISEEVAEAKKAKK